MSNVPSIAIGYTFNGDATATNLINAAQVDTQLGNLASTQNLTKAALDVITDSTNSLVGQSVGFTQLKQEVRNTLLSRYGSTLATTAKTAVRLVGIANVATLSGAATLDGIAAANGDSVLLTAQTDNRQNGVWVVNTAGAWARRSDTPAGAAQGNGWYVIAYAGSSQLGMGWGVYSPGTNIVGTDPMQFVALAQPFGVPVTVANGGTGAVTPAGARLNLGVSAAMDPVVTAATVEAGRNALGNVSAIVDTLTQLKALAAPITATTYVVRGYYAAGDGGGGYFRWVAGDVTTDNGGTVVQLTAGGTGRWNRIYDTNINVKWFGARGDGTTDDTAAIQAALSSGNKVVKLLGFGYFVSSLIIPAGVHLRGENSMGPNHSGGVITGTYLKITQTSAVAVTLGKASKVSGIAFWYPNQPVTTSVPTLIVYPASIDATATGAQVDNVWCSGAYDFILAGSMATITNIGGYPCRYGIYIASAFDVIRIHNVHFNPNYLVAGSGIPGQFYVFCAVNTFSSVIKIDSADDVKATNIFGYCQWFGCDLTGSGANTPSLQLTNFGFDQCHRAFVFNGNAGNFGVSVSNGYATPNIGSSATCAGIHFLALASGGNYRFNNVSFFGVGDASAPGSAAASKYVTADAGCYQNILQVTNLLLRHHTAANPIDLTNFNECRVSIDGQLIPSSIVAIPDNYRKSVPFHVENFKYLGGFMPTIEVSGFGNNDSAKGPSYSINGFSYVFSISADGLQAVVLNAKSWAVTASSSFNNISDGGVAFTTWVNTNAIAGTILVIGSRNFVYVNNAPSQTTLAANFGLLKFAQADNPFTIHEQDSYACVVALDSAGVVYSKELRGSKNIRVAAVTSTVAVNNLNQMPRHA